MKSEKFSSALGEIDVRYVEEVVNYNAVHKQKRPIWKIVAVCVAIVMLIGIIPLWNSGNKASQGFVLVAYASENNIIIENELQEGKSVPISFFETENGLQIGEVCKDIYKERQENLDLPLSKVVRIATEEDLSVFQVHQKPSVQVLLSNILPCLQVNFLKLFPQVYQEYFP